MTSAVVRVTLLNLAAALNQGIVDLIVDVPTSVGTRPLQLRHL